MNKVINKWSISVLIICVILLMPIPVLSLDDMYENKTYLVRSFSRNDVFYMTWIHSVELEPWEEWFGVEDGQIILKKTRFKAFGAGVPDKIGEKTYMEDDYVVYDEINKLIDHLTYGISPTAKHSITINKELIPLYQLIPADTGIEIKYKKISLINYIILRY